MGIGQEILRVLVLTFITLFGAWGVAGLLVSLVPLRSNLREWFFGSHQERRRQYPPLYD